MTKKERDPIYRRELPGGSIVCGSRVYTDRDELPIDPEAPVVALRLSHCFETAPAPEYGGPVKHITGRFLGERYTCCINQAGLHIELWLSPLPEPEASVRTTEDILSVPVTKARARKVYRYGGDFDEAKGEFQLYSHRNREEIRGKLVIGLSPEKVSLKWGESTAHDDDVLFRFETRATLSDDAVAALDPGGLAAKDEVVAGLLEAEHAPPSPTAVAELKRVFEMKDSAPSTLRTQLRRLFSLAPSHTNASRAEIKRGIDAIEHNLLRELAEHASFSHRRSLPWALQPYLREQRLHITLASGLTETRSLYEWLQIVLHWDREYTAGGARRLHAIQTWLAVQPARPHRYTLTLDIVGRGFDIAIPFSKVASDKLDKLGDEYIEQIPIVGKAVKGAKKWLAKKIDSRYGGRLFAGSLMIHHDSPTNPWTHTYPVSFYVFSTGRGGASMSKVEIFATGTTETSIEWQPSDFVGLATIMTGWWAGDKQGERKENQQVWVAEGSGPDASIQLVFDSVVTKRGQDYLGYWHGEIGDPQFEREAPAYAKPRKVVDYSAPHGDLTTAHFVRGSATIQDEGRHRLRVFAASELALIREVDSGVTIEGFADRPGRRWYNDILAEQRARNTKRALVDCLDADLHAKVVTDSHGERPLEALDKLFDFPDRSATPEWRRVLVILNAHVVVSLIVPDSTATP
jgi:outer membrane protein OmpA-like peptidoglycan-associated protein